MRLSSGRRTPRLMPLRRGVRRPIFLSAEVSASLQQQYDPPTGNRPRKGWPNSMRWLVAFSPDIFIAAPAIQGLDYLSTGLPETAIVTAPVVRLRSRAREQQDRSSSRFCVRFRWIRRAWNEKFS
jgi:hypothetical protein